MLRLTRLRMWKPVQIGRHALAESLRCWIIRLRRSLRLQARSRSQFGVSSHAPACSRVLEHPNERHLRRKGSFLRQSDAIIECEKLLQLCY